ncbi:hypothetical protein OHB12_18990 [Nocardia sp. NBC_01730]|uniref:hypothetical protein n=1 Tax=Nocardia sp. NBC_01730 TaxID=2975998 RepID=UPI002E13A47C|nr:hypothetical protein OHB12_18990 [Nocardia sp. NBC_01730]
MHPRAGLGERAGRPPDRRRRETNEILCPQALLTCSGITGAVIAADAMHCRGDTATMITDGGGHYIRTVESDRRDFHERVKAPAWKDIPLRGDLDRTRSRQADTPHAEDDRDLR